MPFFLGVIISEKDWKERVEEQQSNFIHFWLISCQDLKKDFPWLSSSSVVHISTLHCPSLIFFIWILRPVKIISLILSRVNRKVGRKREIPEKKHLDHPPAELGLSHIWPEIGSNSPRWDDERFRALKLSDLNHSAMGTAVSEYAYSGNCK